MQQVLILSEDFSNDICQYRVYEKVSLNKAIEERLQFFELHHDFDGFTVHTMTKVLQADVPILTNPVNFNDVKDCDTFIVVGYHHSPWSYADRDYYGTRIGGSFSAASVFTYKPGTKKRHLLCKKLDKQTLDERQRIDDIANAYWKVLVAVRIALRVSTVSLSRIYRDPMYKRLLLNIDIPDLTWILRPMRGIFSRRQYQLYGRWDKPKVKWKKKPLPVQQVRSLKRQIRVLRYIARLRSKHEHQERKRANCTGVGRQKQDHGPGSPRSHR